MRLGFPAFSWPGPDSDNIDEDEPAALVGETTGSVGAWMLDDIEDEHCWRFRVTLGTLPATSSRQDWAFS